MSANRIKPLFRGFVLAFSMSAQFATMAAAMAAEINVTTLTDEDVANADCSLREAIVAANTDAANKGCTAGAGADTIRFLVNGTIVLASSLPTVTWSVSIIGPGVADLTIDGDEQFSMFYFDFAADGDDANYLIKGLSLIDGSGPTGTAPAVFALNDVDVVIEDAVIRGMSRTGPDGGGAIKGQGGATLTIRRSTFFDNSTFEGSGGAISATGMIVIVEDSLFVGNSANGTTADGGAISVGSSGNLTLRRSTFSGNTSSDDGGALAMFAASASITIESSTFKANTAAATGGAFMLNAGTASIRNTVIAENQIIPAPGGTPTSNISYSGSATLTSLGHNLIGANDGAATAFPAGNPNTNDDYVGTTASPIDPLLFALADNGGPTLTHRILVNSPLIDQGSCAGELHDQRLYGHPLNGLRIIDIPEVADSDDGCDIGAFERGAQIPEPLFLDGFETPDP